MNFEFENRWYSKIEICRKFNIAENLEELAYDARQAKEKSQRHGNL